ncbi:MAG: DNA translocase FtsK [Pseudomonadales bacterium]|jgi:S-DNA-T family DNA segregation ATPase FtsK/SpoIIIE|nr:DNA translocase FtsK [Pseudomonadales bacterium]
MAKRRRGRAAKKQKINHEVWFSIGAVFFLVAALLVMVSFIRQGEILIAVNNFLSVNFGPGALFIPFLLIQLSLVLFRTNWIWSRPIMLLSGWLIFSGVTGLSRGGSVGNEAFLTLRALISTPGVIILNLALVIAGAMVLFQVSLRDVFEKIKEWTTAYQLKKEMARLEQATLEGEEVAFVGAIGSEENGVALENVGGDQNYDEVMASEMAQELDGMNEDVVMAQEMPVDEFQKIDVLDTQPAANDLEILAEDGVPVRKPWIYPSLQLFSDSDGGEADRGDINANAAIIESTLESFGIKARVVEVNRGPSVTQYALEIAMGTKLSKITALATDLALALAASTGQIRIEAPIAGKSLVGVEVPNRKAAFVTLRKMLASPKLDKHPSRLAVALGLDVNGSQVVGDVAKMPHALVAGATGSGKSVGINAILCSMLYRSSPEELRLILVDPKRVELTMYNNIPHLLTPVIVEAEKVVAALKWACVEMDRRYQLLSEHQVRNIDGFNELPGVEKLPKIVIVIDEFADVMMFAPSEVEEAVTRIAQMARAVGIHLILATQRPSVNVITGLIKANVPTRIAFNVASLMDSRVILDAQGAEKLLGNGDMLYIPPDKAKPVRVQGTFVSDEDAKKLTDFLKSQNWDPDYVSEITTKYTSSTVKGGGGGANGGGDRDPLFAQAVKIFAQYDQASSSMIQRRLSVGYARAARILDQLHSEGFVGPANGSKPRDINKEKVLQFLSDPNNLE